MLIKTNIPILMIITTFLSINYRTNAQLTEKESWDKTLRNEMKFNDWPGKNNFNREGINLSKVKIPELNDAVEKRPANLFYISKTQNDSLFVQYCSKWQQSDISFMEVTISYLNSAIEAQEYLMEYYILGSSLPLEVLKRARDNPTLIGDVSFYNGHIFVRNNIIINIHSEGKMQNIGLPIAKKIDSLLLSQEVIKIKGISKPLLIKDNKGNLIIIEP